MNRLSSADAPVEEAPARDEQREGLVERLRAELGDDARWPATSSPGCDLWVRVRHRRVAAAGGRRPRRARVRLLLLPVGHRLAAVAVRQGRGRPDRAAARALHRGRAGLRRWRRRACRCWPGSHSTTEHVGLTLKADVPDDTRHDRHLGAHLRRGQLARARGLGDVRHHLRRPPRPAPHLPADRLRGLPPPQGLPAPGPDGEAVAGHRGRRADAGRASTTTRPSRPKRRADA